MPYTIRKLPNKNKFRVYRFFGTKKSEVVAKETTLKKAKAQVRLLEGIKHGWKPSRGSNG